MVIGAGEEGSNATVTLPFAPAAARGAGAHRDRAAPAPAVSVVVTEGGRRVCAGGALLPGPPAGVRSCSMRELSGAGGAAGVEVEVSTGGGRYAFVLEQCNA